MARDYGTKRHARAALRFPDAAVLIRLLDLKQGFLLWFFAVSDSFGLARTSRKGAIVTKECLLSAH